MEDAIKVLDEAQKFMLKELEDQRNEFDKRLNDYVTEFTLFCMISRGDN